jgi:hypothetical protein
MDSSLRTLLREYLQTGDYSVLSSLIATANRGGVETVSELVHQLCAIDLQNVEETLLRLFGPGDIRKSSNPHQNPACHLFYQKFIQVYHQRARDWEMSIGINYIRTVGKQDDRGFLLEKPGITIYPGVCESPEVSRAYRALCIKFPHYSVGISHQYPLRHEALYGCIVCGRFPMAMGSEYCIFHDKHQKKTEPQRNPASLIQYLTGPEFVEMMKWQDIYGKHGAAQPYWQRIADYAAQQAKDPTRLFVLVQDVPLSWLSLEHAPENRELISQYANKKSEFPPIYISLTDHQLSQDPNSKPKVKNGNHRVTAARRRGDTSIEAVMTLETWSNIQSTDFRKNPDETFRKLERELQRNDTFENRVRFLGERMRTGAISSDRVEAAAEIGCKEAQEFFKPTGVVGTDWAISVLADHLPLRPIMEQIVMHAVETFLRDAKAEDPQITISYVRKTFANPRFNSLPLEAMLTSSPGSLGRAGRFIDAASQHLRDLLNVDITDWVVYDRITPLVTAVRRVWFLPPNLISENQQGQMSDDESVVIAYGILALVGNTPSEVEWQRQLLIRYLLENTL